jgi:hypothetical protein
MSAWWGREAWGPLPAGATVARAAVRRGAPASAARGREAVERAVAGRPLVHARVDRPPAVGRRCRARPVFSEEMEPVLARADRLPEKALVEFLRDAGIESLPATPAAALAGLHPLAGGQGVGAGAGGLPGRRAARHGAGRPRTSRRRATSSPRRPRSRSCTSRRGRWSGGSRRPRAPTRPLRPFGRKAEAGRALFLGLATEDPGGAHPRAAHAGRRRGRSAGGAAAGGGGGVTPLPVPPPPLRWDLDGAVEAARGRARRDGGLVRSGVIELELPRTCAPGS